MPLCLFNKWQLQGSGARGQVEDDGAFSGPRGPSDSEILQACKCKLMETWRKDGSTGGRVPLSPGEGTG